MSEWKNFPSLPLHIPESISAVVIAYDVPGLNSTPLQLNGNVTADIFLGKVTNWNDPEIASLNREQSLPDHAIIPLAAVTVVAASLFMTNFPYA